MENKFTKLWFTCVILKLSALSKGSPRGENSPNLVTLISGPKVRSMLEII
jgi:hypothetical protein